MTDDVQQASYTQESRFDYVQNISQIPGRIETGISAP